MSEGSPEVFPVNFVVSGEWVVFLTKLGSKLSKGARSAPIAFEVDDYETIDHSGWSVLVTGRAEEVTGAEKAGLSGLRLLPWAGGPRRRFMRLSTREIHGRRLGEPHRRPL